MKHLVLTTLLFLSFSALSSNSLRNYLNTSTIFLKHGYDVHTHTKQGLFLHLGYEYMDNPLIIKIKSNQTKIGTVIDHSHSIPFGLHYRRKRLSLGLNTKFLFLNMGENFTLDSSKSTFGDSHFDITYDLFQFKKSTLGVEGFLIFPTGNQDYFTSFDSLGFGGNIYYSKIWGSHFITSLSLGYHKAEKGYVGTFDLSEMLITKLSASYQFAKKWRFNLEGIRYFTLPTNDNLNPNELTALLQHERNENFIIWAGLGLSNPLDDEDSRNYNFTAGLKYRIWKPTPKKLPLPKPEPLPEYTSLSRKVLFDLDKANIKPESYPELDSAIAFINKYMTQIKRITIEGHTDSRASAHYNRKLSQRRADAVMRYLALKGVPRHIMRAIGYGEDQLLVYPEKTKEDYLRNRRVVFKIENIRVK